MTTPETFLELTVVADTNDGDYMTEINKISEEDLKRFLPLFAAIQDSSFDHNWCTSYYERDPCPRSMYARFDSELIEEFDQLVPHGEYGVHTIDSIRVRLVQVLSNTEYV